MLAPIRFKGAGIFRTYDDHLGLPLDEFLVILAQLRHVPAAEWSNEAAVEHEQDMRCAAKIGQAKWLALIIGQGEVRGGGIKQDLRHRIYLYGLILIKKFVIAPINASGRSHA